MENSNSVMDMLARYTSHDGHVMAGQLARDLIASQARIAELEAELRESAAYAEHQRSRAAVAEQQQATCLDDWRTACTALAAADAAIDRVRSAISKRRRSHVSGVAVMHSDANATLDMIDVALAPPSEVK